MTRHPADRAAQDYKAQKEKAQEQKAVRELDRLSRQGDAIGGIFSRWLVAPVKSDDPIEIWGTRIGRGLSAAFIVAICLYLLWTLFR